MKRYLPLFVIVCFLALSACQRRNSEALVSTSESKLAKSLLQGIWVEEETEEVTFRAKGDTLYYTDPLNQPLYFKVVNDTLVLGKLTYAIVKQSAHLFWFKNQNGDLIKLVKSDDPNHALLFHHDQPQTVSVVMEQQKTDSVVMYGGRHFHWYIAVNPTKYKVSKTNYSGDGVGMENVYYDNIIHLSLFEGADKLFSRDFKKAMFMGQVPADFLDQAVLGNIQYDSIDERGFHFNATLCIPDMASCYMVAVDISFAGQMGMRLVEY